MMAKTNRRVGRVIHLGYQNLCDFHEIGIDVWFLIGLSSDSILVLLHCSGLYREVALADDRSVSTVSPLICGS